jgi:hypothetical protein
MIGVQARWGDPQLRAYQRLRCGKVRNDLVPGFDC